MELVREGTLKTVDFRDEILEPPWMGSRRVLKVFTRASFTDLNTLDQDWGLCFLIDTEPAL